MSSIWLLITAIWLSVIGVGDIYEKWMRWNRWVNIIAPKIAMMMRAIGTALMGKY
jgi:hypothetical protein